MTRSEMREIVGQEDNQLALARRDLPGVDALVDFFRQCLTCAEGVRERSPAMDDAVGDFCNEIDGAIARLAKAANDVRKS